MLIEFVSKTADGRTAAPRGNRGCAYREGERARRRKEEEAGDVYRLFLAWPFLLYPFFFLLLDVLLSLPYNSSISLVLPFALAASLILSNCSCLSLSFSSWLGSRGGKACIIRRNSGGINPRTDPQSSRFCPSLSSN